MTKKVLAMKKIRELLRLKLHAKLTNREIARAIGVSASSVSYYTRAADNIGLTWPLAPEFNDSVLIELLAPHCKQFNKPKSSKYTPEFTKIKQELADNKHVTLRLLWEEYAEQYKENIYSYANFCRMYRSWCKQHKITMKQEYPAGEKCFIDYAGDTIPIWDKQTQTITATAQIFIAALGCSNYCFIDATYTQQKKDWISSNTKALEFFGGVPAMLIPDNLKTGITDSCPYDPVINPSYFDFAQHYDTVILPARPRTPRDKATVEGAVLIVERWVMARLRKYKFYSLAALKTKIKELMSCLNNKPFQKKEGSRYSQFLAKEQNKLRPLPQHRYQFAEFKTCLVQNNYHVSLNNNQYSVPYYLVGKQVECKYTSTLVEIFYQNQRIASHIICCNKGNVITLTEHMPHNHKAYKQWNIDFFLSWAKSQSPGLYNLAGIIIEQKQHPAQVHRFYLGLKQLLRRYGTYRLNNACCRAIALSTISYHSLNSILKTGLDNQPYLTQVIKPQKDKHEYIRGADYYSDCK